MHVEISSKLKSKNGDHLNLCFTVCYKNGKGPRAMRVEKAWSSDAGFFLNLPLNSGGMKKWNGDRKRAPGTCSDQAFHERRRPLRTDRKGV